MDGEDEEKQSKLVRLEIPAQKSLQYEYLYETEGPIELSQLSVIKPIVLILIYYYLGFDWCDILFQF